MTRMRLVTVLLVSVAGCTAVRGEDTSAPAPPQTETSNTSTTVQAVIPKSGTSTIVGVVTSIGPSEQGGKSWAYRLLSGETLDVPKGLSQGCSYWGGPPISLGEEHRECAIVALVEPGGTATLVRDLHIPTDEDANLWQELIGDRVIGLLRISDLSGDRTEVITDEGFALEVAADARWGCDPTTFHRHAGVELVVDLDTSRVRHVECMGIA